MRWLSKIAVLLVVAGAVGFPAYYYFFTQDTDREAELAATNTDGDDTSLDDPLGSGTPRGFDPTVIAELERQLESLVETQDRAGFVALLARDGETQHTLEVGYADVEAETPMQADSLIRVASMTKPVTAVAVLTLVENGAISLDDPVSDYIPAFANTQVATSYSRNSEFEIPAEPLTEPMTIRHLMTHTSGLGYVFDYETNLGALYIDVNPYSSETGLADGINELAELPLYFQPGERWNYSWSSDVLGHIVEIVSEQDLDSYMSQTIFEPLEMMDTGFAYGGYDADRLATLYTHDDAGDLVPTSSESDWAQNLSFASGGASLLSTANDYMKFAQMLANGGELDGVRILSEELTADMLTAHVREDALPNSMARNNAGYGYGIGVWYGASRNGHYQSGDFGWPGYFDTEFIVSPDRGVVALIMTQEDQGATTSETVGARDIFSAFISEAIQDRTG